ncbi:PAS domain S-box protein (plasmid) [Paracoccus yeei]|uniref:histidine kinase n=1 Tax=Paracoccus yeei TaxID=147645 RepID=A0A1V0GZ03_9RHOB|nr:PAS domain-containing protein [Paracoccus yeei]ARC39067.2 PAS domain S-box protein [Paracoccus yeei]OWJ91739.1 hybrid sensor histidine kinase/response regulator [Paracoccus yeei]
MPHTLNATSLGTLTDGDRLRLALAAGAIVGTWFWDVTADRFTVDEQFAAAFGLDPALGRAGLSLAQVIATVHPDDKAGLTAAIKQAIARGGPYAHQYRVRRLNGSYHWIEANGRVDRDAAGTITFPGVLLDVDERRVLAAERDRAKRLLEAFIEAVPGVVYAKDRNGRMLVANRGTLELVGKPLAEILGRTDAEFLSDPAEAEAIMRLDAAVMASGQTLVAEEAVRRPDGTPAVWLSTKSAFRGEDGQVIGLIGSSVDITDRRCVEASLRETEERYRLAAQATNDAIWDWRLADGHVIWNNALEDRLGHALRETSAAWWIEHIHPDDRDRVDQSIHAVIDGSGTGWTEEYRFRRADGSYAAILDRGFVLRDDGGRATRMIGAMQDLTDRRAAEAAVRESEERARLAAEAASMGTWDLDLRSRDLRWDARTKALFGLALDARVTFEDSFLGGAHPEDRDRVRSAVEAAVTRHGTGTFAVEFRTAAGTDGAGRWVAARGRTLFSDDGEPLRFIGTMVDITELKTAEARLRELNETLESRVAQEIAEREQAEEALRQSQKMEALGQLTGGIAHDFNNLLQGITGSLSVIQRRIGQGRTDDLDRFIEGAAGAAARAAALTHRLLAFSRRQPLDPRPVRANALIASMEDLFRRTMGENVAVEFALAEDLWVTLCDPNQLENAVLNLAINARDAMPGGGRLRIETRNVDADDLDMPHDRSLRHSDYIRIAVSDTGIGMDAATMAKAFEPFFTTKPLGQGTGLGLSMIYGFARQSEGHARIESDPGAGTTVSIFLPRHRAALAEEGAQPAGAAPGTTTSGETVLVVEDETLVRNLVVGELADLGYRVLEAAESAEALAILRSGRRIDLMLTDIGLPGLNGRQLAAAARELRPALKVLLMTGYAQDASRASGFLDHGMELITKPFEMAALVSRLRAMLEGEALPAGTAADAPGGQG